MPRKQVGVAAIKKDKAAAEKFKVKTAELQESSFQAMSCQMETFRQKLEEFARTHKDEIKKDPEFRKHFQVSIPMYTTAHDDIQNQITSLSPLTLLSSIFDNTGNVCFNRGGSTCIF